MAKSDIGRGELYWLDWNPARGSEQAGRRPGLVVGTDAANRNSNYPLTIVVAVSSARRNVPTHVLVEPNVENGLSLPSAVKCEQMMTVSKDRLLDRMGVLSDDDMERVNTALKRALMLQ